MKGFSTINPQGAKVKSISPKKITMKSAFQQLNKSYSNVRQEALKKA